MSYQRVIPRDLFNEASLLKCLGKFWILTERFQPKKVQIEHDGEAFDVWQNEDDGTICVLNVDLCINGVPYDLVRPLNSRQPWPLYLKDDVDGDNIAVFTDAGELTPEIMELIERGPAIREVTGG
jgi:hypothetical protein